MLSKNLVIDNTTSLFSRQLDIVLCKREQQRKLSKRFFPSFMTKIKFVMYVVYRIHPKTSFLLFIKLLSIAVRTNLSVNAVAFYKSGIKKEFKVDGATFCTYTYGNGPLILMLHGWCSQGARWRVYVNELVSSGYKVMVVDAPGHGTAPGRFLSIYLYAKGIKVILESELKWHTVITHSMAGLTALAAIGNTKKTHHPSKFIMMNTFSSANAILETFSCCLGISEKIVQGSREMMSNYIDFPLKEFSIEKQFNAINLEGLLIYDTEDLVVPRKEAEHIISTIKPLQIIKTEGLGHNLKSILIVKEVLNFVNTKNKIDAELDEVALCL